MKRKAAKKTTERLKKAKELEDTEAPILSFSHSIPQPS